jgi:hypothetical protein
MFRKAEVDPLARQMALGIGGSRIAVGVAAFFATRPALRTIGFDDGNTTSRSLAKVLGARDLGLGSLTLAVRNDPSALRAVVLVGACLDFADAVAFGIAARNPETVRPGIIGVLSGGGAALVGFWAWRRLGPA